LNHWIPKNFLILYRFLSFGIVLPLRKRLKKLIEHPMRIATCSSLKSLSLRNCLNLCLNSSMSIFLTYILKKVTCQVFFCTFLYFLLP
jgi:hypothetical protein